MPTHLLPSRPPLAAALVLAALLLLVGSASFARQAQAPTVRFLGDPEAWIAAADAPAYELDRLPEPGEGRLVVFIGTSDVTDLFRRDGRVLTYRPTLLPLPRGGSELVFFLVRDGEWVEIARHPLNVLGRGGLRELSFTPTLDVQGVAQVDEGASPGEAAPGDEEGTLQIDVRGTAARGSWSFAGGANVAGFSEREQALRFDEEGDDAERVDLANYQLLVSRNLGDELDPLQFTVGHVAVGSHRDLVEGFDSRGVTASAPLGRRAAISLAAVNGSSVVGFDNFLGLQRSEHRLTSAETRFALLEGPSSLELSLAFLDGSVLPIDGFNSREVNDTEESTGWSTRLSGAFLDRRLRFTGAWTRSDFDNPFDPLLAQGEDLVPVEEEERDARYLEVDVDLLRDHVLGGGDEGRPSNLVLSVRHSEVDPQYRSVGAFTQADLRTEGVSLNGNLGLAAVGAAYQRSRDNLDRIASILTTKTRTASAALGLPLPEVGRYLPSVSWAWTRTHQYGAGVPENSGFNESHVPDQVALDHTLNVDWQGNRWRAGTIASWSEQDNRQPGRVDDDFESLNLGVGFGVSPLDSLDLGVDLIRERARSVGDDQVDLLRSLAFQLYWRPAARWTVDGAYTLTDSEDEPRTATSDSVTADLSLAYRFSLGADRRHGLDGQAFLRFSRYELETRDLIFDIDLDESSWSLSTGLALSFH